MKEAGLEADLVLLRGEELLAGDGERDSVGVRISSLSSSLIVSSIFGALCLMTLTNCGGATSVTNLASLEFAISLFVLSTIRRRREDEENDDLGCVKNNLDCSEIYMLSL